MIGETCVGGSSGKWIFFVPQCIMEFKWNELELIKFINFIAVFQNAVIALKKVEFTKINFKYLKNNLNKPKLVTSILIYTADSQCSL